MGVLFSYDDYTFLGKKGGGAIAPLAPPPPPATPLRRLHVGMAQTITHNHAKMYKKKYTTLRVTYIYRLDAESVEIRDLESQGP